MEIRSFPLRVNWASSEQTMHIINSYKAQHSGCDLATEQIETWFNRRVSVEQSLILEWAAQSASFSRIINRVCKHYWMGKRSKEIESWLLKNAISFEFLAKQALLIVYLPALMELLQTAEVQGKRKIQSTATHFNKHLQFYFPRENTETVKFPLPNDHFLRLIREGKTNKMQNRIILLQ